MIKIYILFIILKQLLSSSKNYKSLDKTYHVDTNQTLELNLHQILEEQKVYGNNLVFDQDPNSKYTTEYSKMIKVMQNISLNGKQVVKTQVDQQRDFYYILYSDFSLDVYHINTWDGIILQNISIQLNSSSSVFKLKKCHDLKFNNMMIYVDCQIINLHNLYGISLQNTVFVVFPIYSIKNSLIGPDNFQIKIQRSKSSNLQKQQTQIWTNIDYCFSRFIKIFQKDQNSYIIQFCKASNNQKVANLSVSANLILYKYDSQEFKFIFLQDLSKLILNKNMNSFQIEDVFYFQNTKSILVVEKSGTVYFLQQQFTGLFYFFRQKQIDFLYQVGMVVNITIAKFYGIYNINQTLTQNILMFAQQSDIYWVDVTNHRNIRFIKHIQIFNGTRIMKFLLTRNFIILNNNQSVYGYKIQNPMQKVHFQLDKNVSSLHSFDDVQLTDNIVQISQDVIKIIRIQDTFLKLKIFEEGQLAFRVYEDTFISNQENLQLNLNFQIIKNKGYLQVLNASKNDFQIYNMKDTIDLTRFIEGQEITHHLVNYREDEELEMQIQDTSTIRLMQYDNSTLLIDSLFLFKKKKIILLYRNDTHLFIMSLSSQQEADKQAIQELSLNDNDYQYGFILNEQQVFLSKQQEGIQIFQIWRIAEKYPIMVTYDSKFSLEEMHYLSQNQFCLLSWNRTFIQFVSLQQIQGEWSLRDTGNIDHTEQIIKINTQIFSQNTLYFMDSKFVLYRYIYFVSEANNFIFLLQWNFTQLGRNCSFELFQLTDIVSICPSQDFVYLYYLKSNSKIQKARKQINLQEYYPQEAMSLNSKKGLLYLKTHYFDYTQLGIAQSIIVIDPSQSQQNAIILKIKSQNNFIYFPKIISDNLEIDYLITIEDNYWVLREIHQKMNLKITVKKKFAIDDKETFQKECKMLALSSRDNNAYFYTLNFNISSRTFLEYVKHKQIFDQNYWENSKRIEYLIPVEKLKGPIERLSFIQQDYKDSFQISIDPVIDKYNYQEPFSSQWNHDTVGYYIDHTTVNNRYLVFLFSKYILISNATDKNQILNFTMNFTNPYYGDEFDEDLKQTFKCFLSSFHNRDIFFLHCGKTKDYKSEIHSFNLMSPSKPTVLLLLNNRITVKFQAIQSSNNTKIPINNNYQDFLLVSSYDLQFQEKLVNIFRINIVNNILSLQNIEITNYFQNQLFYTIDVSIYQYSRFYLITLLSDSNKLDFIVIDSDVADGGGKFNIIEKGVYDNQKNEVDSQTQIFQSCQIFEFSMEREIIKAKMFVQQIDSMRVYQAYWKQNEIQMYQLKAFQNYNLCKTYDKQVLYGPSSQLQIIVRVCSTFLNNYQNDVKSISIYKWDEKNRNRFEQQMISFMKLPHAINQKQSLHKVGDQWILIVPSYYSLLRIYKINLDFTLIIQQNRHIEDQQFNMHLHINASNNQRESRLELEISLQQDHADVINKVNTFILKISLTICATIIVVAYMSYIKYLMHLQSKEQQDQSIFIVGSDDQQLDDSFIEDNQSIKSHIIN